MSPRGSKTEEGIKIAEAVKTGDTKPEKEVEEESKPSTKPEEIISTDDPSKITEVYILGHSKYIYL